MWPLALAVAPLSISVAVAAAPLNGRTLAVAKKDKSPGPDWVQAPDGTWHQRVQTITVQQPKQKDGCAKPFLGVLLGLIIVGVVIALIAGGGSKKPATSADAVSGSAGTTTTSTEPPPTSSSEEIKAAEDAVIAGAEYPDVDAIVKDPDASRGKVLVMIAEIIQYDAATGPCLFRAHWDNTMHQYNFEYKGDNAVFTSGDGDQSCPALDGVDASDVVKVWVRSLGSMEYESLLAGDRKAPSFEVLKAEIVAKK